MKLNSVLTFTLATLFAQVLAAPASELDASSANETNLEKRTPGNVYVCTSPGWASGCDNVWIGITGQCQPIPAPWRYNVGSLGPDRGAICRLFDDAHSDCTGSGLAILQYPGSDNLITPQAFPGYKAAYWRCTECTNCQ